MKVMTIAEVLELQDGQAVTAVRGTLVAVYPQKTGKYKSGPNVGNEWRIQNCKLKDDTGEIALKLDGRDPLPKNWQGNDVYLCQTKNGKGKWMGLTCVLDTYQGNTSTVLKATSTAEITEAGDPNAVGAHQTDPGQDHEGQEVAHEAEAPAPTQVKAQAQKAPQASSQPANQAQPARKTKDEIEHEYLLAVQRTKKEIAQGANLYFLCLQAGAWNMKRYEEEFGEPMMPEQFQAMVSGLFIKADRAGLSLGLPHGDLTPYLPAKQSAE